MEDGEWNPTFFAYILNSNLFASTEPCGWWSRWYLNPREPLGCGNPIEGNRAFLLCGPGKDLESPRENLRMKQRPLGKARLAEVCAHHILSRVGEGGSKSVLYEYVNFSSL